MKLFKLSAITAVALCSSVAMAATPAQQQAYQYNQNAGIISNTAGAVTGTAKTLFNTATHPGAISAEIGTLGYGANIGWGITDAVELQAGWSGFSTSGDEDDWFNWDKLLGDGYIGSQGDTDFDAKFSNPYIGVQMRPWANAFTVAGGIMVPRNKVEAKMRTGAQGADVTIDGTEYNVNGLVRYEIENKNSLAPYLTVGYRPNITQRVGGFVEAGVAYMGDLKSDVRIEEGTTIASNNPNSVNANAEFERAAEKEARDHDTDWYPIVKAGVTYRF